MDFSDLTPTAQRELATVFTDEFCYCGCPHTLEACLKTHPKCSHARRMASLAALEADKGALGPEIILSLGNYYQSFGQKRAGLKPDARMCRGPMDAKVTLIEFFDYECPGCGVARAPLDAFAKAHPQHRFCVLPFPLSGHPNALPAGQAALFARDKGKFWPMHDLLFDNQRRLSPQVILELAGQIGLPVSDLRKAMDAGRYLDELKASREAGIHAGVESTPSIFINGRKLGLPVEPEMLNHAVEDELEWSSHQNAWAAD
jgi:protein-disulfide isomerase